MMLTIEDRREDLHDVLKEICIAPMEDFQDVVVNEILLFQKDVTEAYEAHKATSTKVTKEDEAYYKGQMDAIEKILYILGWSPSEEDGIKDD